MPEPCKFRRLSGPKKNAVPKTAIEGLLLAPPEYPCVSENVDVDMYKPLALNKKLRNCQSGQTPEPDAGHNEIHVIFFFHPNSILFFKHSVSLEFRTCFNCLPVFWGEY